MRLPLHDAEILYVISNPLKDFIEIIFSIENEYWCLARILIIGIHSIKTISDQDLYLFFAEGGGVDEAILTETEKGFILDLSGIMNDLDKYNQINWEFIIHADSIFYEEKKVSENEDEEYLKAFSIGGENIPKVGDWSRTNKK